MKKNNKEQQSKEKNDSSFFLRFLKMLKHLVMRIIELKLNF